MKLPLSLFPTAGGASARKYCRRCLKLLAKELGGGSEEVELPESREEHEVEVQG